MRYIVVEESGNKLIQVFDINTDSYVDLIETVSEKLLLCSSHELILTEEEAIKLLNKLKEILEEE